MSKLDETRIHPSRVAPPVRVEVLRGLSEQPEVRFTDTFVIGRHSESDFSIQHPYVSRSHAKLFFHGDVWFVQDLDSRNGTYVNGERIRKVPLPDEATLELGEGGPVLHLVIERGKRGPPEHVTPASTERPSSVTQIIHQYFEKKPKSGTVGEHTMMFRRAFERVHKKKSRKYLALIGASLVLLASAGGVILHQERKLATVRNTAEDMFYAIKTLELQIAQLEDIVRQVADESQIADLREKRQQLEQLTEDYDQFLRDLDVYGDLPIEKQIVFRMARLFGECELNVPADFTDEVFRYIEKWKTTDRLKKALLRAERNGYAPVIVEAMAEHHLPPHFFFLALQESDFKARAVGPQTKFGYAKGIWQFVPITAHRYNLNVGPLYQKGVYDPGDERYDFQKATGAAARYLRDINHTEAQASGLLVMASYNWGENKVTKMIKEMPENPKERNFWRLLAHGNIPQETYHYVFYIFSAAVICENPQLFGFDFECPAFQEQ